MARPRKADVDRLPALLRARCSALDLDRVRAKAKAAGLSPSAYVRRVVLEDGLSHTPHIARHAPAHVADPVARQTEAMAADPKNAVLALVIALNRIGVNLNQAVRIANMNGYLPDELRDVCVELKNSLASVTEALSR